MIYVDEMSLGSYMHKHLERENIDHIVIASTQTTVDNKSNIRLMPKKEAYCRACPATKTYNCCNYYNTDVMEGCPFDCSYCILQAYLDHVNIQISSDTTGIINSITELSALGIKRRLGTGELSDSLALDNIFPFSKVISPLINSQDIIQFEYKTKSANINNLLNLNPKNIVVSWSINPQSIIDKHEHGTASLKNRIAAAAICAKAGYKIGFHFDPVIYYEGYDKEYENTIASIIGEIKEESVEYISMSTFRGPSALIDAMRLRKNVPDILQGDFITAIDGKTRYFRPLRTEMLKKLASYFRKEWKNVFIYLCMEKENVWKDVLGITPGNREETEALFPWYKTA